MRDRSVILRILWIKANFDLSMFGLSGTHLYTYTIFTHGRCFHSWRAVERGENKGRKTGINYLKSLKERQSTSH